VSTGDRRDQKKTGKSGNGRNATVIFFDDAANENCADKAVSGKV
jgi:hypothetical protein